MARSTPLRAFFQHKNNRRACWVVVLAFFLLPGLAAAEGVFWGSGEDCRPVGFEELRCGSHGSFYLSREAPATKSACLTHGATPAELGAYPAPADISRVKAAPESWQPCADGQCLTDRPDGPWVAIVDWNHPHGWSVAETILQASDARVQTRLYALDASGLDTLAAHEGVGDLHVLAQLCRIAEDVESSHLEAPAAVNLSFGRYLAGTEACDPARGGLTCTIGGVLAHLRNTLGIPIFAAAGNDGQLLFPAADPHVLAMGSLDVGHLGATGVSRPSPRTPAGVAGLALGYGLFLEEDAGDGVWPAPPGTSYASAVAAGWWAGYVARSPRLAARLLGGCHGLLAPTAGGARFHLACDAEVFPGSGLDRPNAFLDTALGGWSPARAEDLARTVRRVNVERRIYQGPSPTLTEAQADRNRPMPEPEPCIPCMISGTGGDEEKDPPPDGGEGMTVIDPKRASVVEIDLSSSRGFPAGYDVVGLYLEVGDATYRFSDSENTSLLGELLLGEIDVLEIGRAPASLADEPVALVYALRFADHEAVFHTSTPILVIP